MTELKAVAREAGKLRRRRLAFWVFLLVCLHLIVEFVSVCAHRVPAHYFPVVGTCDAGEYFFLVFDLMLLAGASSWFAAGWVESRAE